jgi:DNA helicase HerA-like ATPase
VRRVIEEEAPGSTSDVVRRIASDYVRETFAPLLGFDEPRDVVLIERHGVEGAGANLGFDLRVIPYAINTMGLDSDKMLTLLPGLSPLARDLLRLLRERFARDKGFYPPVQAIHAALRHYIRTLKSRAEASLEDTISANASRYVITESGDKSRAAFTTFQVEDKGVSMLGMAERILEEIERAMPHKDTVEALYRRINTLLESELVDVAVALGRASRVHVFREPVWRDIVRVSLESKAPVVLDLRWPMDKGLGSLEGPRLVVYRMLDSLVSWKTRAWLSREPSPRVIVMIDEAHQFFPQEKHSREEQEANRQVASLIARIARLGRARGVGLVFSTHSPRDLHEIIVQLANTKILLRTEKQHAERLDVPQEVARFLAHLPDRVMVVMSHVIKGGYLVARTSPPVTAHFDLSKDISRG